MHTFKDLNITVETKGLVGDHIDTDKILNKEIEVHAFVSKPSKHYHGQLCIWLQIKYKDEMRVLFLQGKKLLEVLEQANPEHFPFKATIVREDKMYHFE